MKFLYHSLCKGKKFQFMGRVVRFSLCQTPVGIGENGIHTIITSLVGHSPQTRPTGISMKLQWTGELCIGKNRGCGAQALKVIKDC